jgi:dihydroxyacetone kinase
MAELEDASRMAVMVNSLGATPLEELYIVYASVSELLKKRGVEIAKAYVGRYATSLEMAGLSVTALALDRELEQLLGAPAASPFFVQIGSSGDA